MSCEHQTILLCGVGGSGMSALALVLMARGYAVRGSDRAWDAGQTPEKFAALKRAGVELVPQDGSGVDASLSALIVSTAVENSIPDVRRAMELGVPVRHRAEVLAEIFHAGQGIAVGGTSGKSTTTAMLGHILRACGQDVTVINGAPMLSAIEAGEAAGLGNAVIGQSPRMVIETDESDRSIRLFTPDIAVLTNISLDHEPVEALTVVFRDFLSRARSAVVVNLDNPAAASLAGTHPHTHGFSLNDPKARIRATIVKLKADGSQAHVIEQDGDQGQMTLHVPGRHNIENALAALTAARLAGVALADALAALASFQGVKRRLEVLGSVAGVTVIDDFAHNPDKIAASLDSLRQTAGRLLVMFQPHGFLPMRIMGAGIAESFAKGLSEGDVLLMPEIYYAGGTATRDVSSRDTVMAVRAAGRDAHFLPDPPGAERRVVLREFLLSHARPDDRIVIMGARDDTLTEFAHDLLERLRLRAQENERSENFLAICRVS